MPGFRPSFSVDRNGKRTYDLIPNRISLVKYGEDANDPNGDNKPSDKGDHTPGSTTPSGGSPSGSEGSENSGNTDKGTGEDNEL